MFNRERTKELLGYDLDLSRTRRTKEDYIATGGVKRGDLSIVDNCPECNTERQISLKQSRKNKPCSKCFHNTPKMKEIKRNQTKFVSEETKQKMSANHWSKKGSDPWNKDKTDIYSEKTIEKIRVAANTQWDDETKEEKYNRYKKASCTLRDIPIKDFNGFSAPEGTRIRQSAEGKAWRYDVMAKANFTCDKCGQRGGSLQAHHLEAFNSSPELRFDPDNGVCLCESCHLEFHKKYGSGDNTKEQYNEYV